jgi:hypothetical protein
VTAAALVLLSVLARPPAARPQVPVHDPLTPAEADQVRDTAGKPEKRLPLLLSFAEQRLAAFEKLRAASPRPPQRDAQLYTLLREYALILPEFDDAASDFASGADATSLSDRKKYNVPKILAPVLARLQQLQATLQHIQSDSSPTDLANYHFELQHCLDVTGDTIADIQDELSPAPAEK